MLYVRNNVYQTLLCNSLDIAFEQPTPKVLILDLTLITGMDTSTVDILSDIKTMCASNECKLFLCGLAPRMRSTLALGGVKPETGEHSKRHLRMFPDLDSALGKAEDFLIRRVGVEQTEREARPRLLSEGDNGFRYALRQIDKQVRECLLYARYRSGKLRHGSRQPC